MEVALAAPSGVSAPLGPELMNAQGISKRYPLGRSHIQALDGVTLSIRKGEFLGLTGPSGSGKSTLLHILGLLDTPDAGAITLEGEALETLTPRLRTLLRRELIGFVFQSFNLVPVMSVFDNVEYPLVLSRRSSRERRSRTSEILERVELARYAKQLPDKLSGGQRQRVAIARALVKRPRLVIADEPTASLDTKTALRVIALMKELASEFGTTFVVATHDPRMASRCDRVVELTDGRIS